MQTHPHRQKMIKNGARDVAHNEAKAKALYDGHEHNLKMAQHRQRKDENERADSHRKVTPFKYGDPV